VPLKHRQWGEGLEHNAVMQMEKAFRSQAGQNGSPKLITRPSFNPVIHRLADSIFRSSFFFASLRLCVCVKAVSSGPKGARIRLSSPPVPVSVA
jgi:hypothetical protein